MKIQKTIFTALLVCCLVFCLNFLSLSHATEKTFGGKTNIRSTIMESFGNQPLFFIQNNGQFDKKVKYFEKGPSHAICFAEDGIYLSLFRQQRTSKNSHYIKADHLKLSFVNADLNPKIEAEGILQTKFNYFVGNNPDKWQTGIPAYTTVQYKEIYKNIDLKIYGNDHQLEYDVVVNPGGDPQVVKFKYEGVNSLTVNEQGELEIELDHGTITQKAPYLYQEVAGRRIEVSGSFKLLADNAYTFAIESYDKEKQLIIDPVIEYSGYIGGDWQDQGNAVTIDSQGNAYITGHTFSYYFPTPAYPRDVATYKYDAYVYKVTPDGTMGYATVFGGTATDWITGAVLEAGNDIAVDSAGNAHVTGSTQSTDFPTTNGAFQRTLGGNVDAFYTVLDSSGNLSYSSYLGGLNIDKGFSIAVDNSGNTYLAGSTGRFHYNTPSNFPLVNPLQAAHGGGDNYNTSYYPPDGFIAKFHFDANTPANTSVIFSTYFGGNDSDAVGGLALDSSGDIYITGSTRSTNLPGASTSPLQSSLGGGYDAFVTKLNSAGNAIVYSTYLGSNYTDYGTAIDVDSVGSAYLTGYISNPGTNCNFPLVNPIQTSAAGEHAAFVTKINSAGSSIDYSTFLGGNSSDRGLDIAVDSNGSAYVCGSTSSPGSISTTGGFPIFNPINGHGEMLGLSDGFIVRLTPAGSGLLYSTFFGGDNGTDIYAEPGADHALGIAVDDNGNAYITGATNSHCLPAPELGNGPRCSGGFGGHTDGFIAKIYDNSPLPPEVISVSPADGEVDVAMDTIITATFNRDMDTSSFEGNFLLFVSGTPVPGNISHSGTHTAIFTPSAPLSHNTVYSAIITTGVQDLAGASLLADHSWNFTIVPPAPDTTPPTILFTDPVTTNDFNIPPVEDISTQTSVTVTFSENMNSDTITNSSFYLRWWSDVMFTYIPITGTISYDFTTQTATINPDNDLPYQTYIELVIENTATDLAGNPFDSESPYGDPTYYGMFKTECDPLGPTVVSTNPTHGAVNVPVDPTISFTFDQDFDPATVDQNTFELWPYPSWDSKIPGTISYDVSTRTLSFTSDTPLQNGNSYYGIVASYNFVTIGGRKLCFNPGVLFTTIAGGPCSPDTTPPTLSAPPDIIMDCTGIGGTAVDLGTPIVSDTCDIDPLVTNDAPALFPAATTIVTWTAMDASGNSVTALQSITISDPQNLCSLISPFMEEPPRIDGTFGFGEWPDETQNQLNLQNGFIRVTNDKTRLYILIDLPGDSGDDAEVPQDSFNLTFDVNNDGAISPGIDLNYALYPGTANIRYQYYTGPDTFSDWQPETFSSMARGFNCFADDGSLMILYPPSPPIVTCNRHRVWEIAIDLKEIHATPGETIALGLQVVSQIPAFTENFPVNYTTDFSNLVHIQLSIPSLNDAFPGGDVLLEDNAVEITQAIQDRENSLPLVQNKDTAARVYAYGASPVSCLVSLFAKKGNEDLPGSPLTIHHLAPSAVNRELLNDTANFKLPPTWTREDVTFHAVARSLSPGTTRDDSTPIDLTFTPKEVPLFWTVKLNTGTADLPSQVTDEELLAQKNFLKTIYPLSDVNFVDKPWEEVGVTTKAGSLADLNEYYDLVFMAWIFGAVITGDSPFELPSQIYGMTVEGGGLSDPVRSGGRGIVARGGSNSGTKEGIMAHEMNHNLGPGDCRLRVDDGMLDDIWGSHVASLSGTQPTDPVWQCVVGDAGVNYGCGAGGPDPDWQELFDNDGIGEVGFDTREPWIGNNGIRTTTIPADFPDLMSYCESGIQPVRWMSPYRWERQFNFFPTAAGVSALFETKGTLTQLPDISQIEDVYYINGQINLDGTGTLSPIINAQGTPLLPEIPGDYAIEFQDNDGNVLQTDSFYISFEEEDDEISGPADNVSFNFRIPMLTGQTVRQITLRHGIDALDAIVVSDNPPEVALDTPSSGEMWNGSGTITWTATDQDNDLLNFSLFYSPDGQTVWIPIARNLQVSAYTVDTTVIPGGTSARIRVIATDGFYTAMDDSEIFTVAQNPPRVFIQKPLDGDLFLSGRQIRFCGDAADREDGTLPQEAFVWFLNGNAFGQGRCITAILQKGVHEITLRASDSHSAGAEAVITIEVRDENYSLADFDTDNDVDGKDLAVFMNSFNQGSENALGLERFALEFGAASFE